MKVGRILQFIIIFIVFFINTNIIASAEEAQTCEYSQAYLKWTELSEEEKAKTIMPPVCKSVSEPETYFNVSTLYATPVKASIPTKYDSRDVNGKSYITPVRHQMQTGSCWAFSALATVESLVLKTSGKSYHLSARHLEYSTARYFLDTLNLEGFNRNVGTGGHGYMASSYFTTGKGPINETEMPFQNNENLIKLNEIQNKTQVIDVNGYVILNNSDGTCTTTIKNKIKEHIMNYGAISTNVYMSEDSKYYRGESASLYYSYSSYKEYHPVNHAVTIVGWDDNYSKNLFSSTNQPKNNGAWIVKNSYGTGWGSYGYFYVSYEDDRVCETLSGAVSYDTTIEDNVYYHDALGVNTEYGYLNTKTYAANVFELKSGQELLKEITFYTHENVPYEVFINTTDGSLTASKFTKVGSGVALYEGYHTFKLTEPLLLENDKFVVMISLDGPAASTGSKRIIPLGVQSYIQNSMYDIKNTTPGLSFVSNSINGPWEDFATDTDLQHFASIKASTDQINYNFTLGTLTSTPTSPYATGTYTITVPITTNYITTNDITVKIYNSSNKDVTNNFNVTKSSSNVKITNKDNTATKDTYKVEFAYKDINRSTTFNIYNQYELLVDGYKTSSTMYDINENTITIPIKTVGYENDEELTIDVLDSNSTSVKESLTITNPKISNNATSIKIKIPKDTTPGKYTVNITGKNENKAKVSYEIVDYIAVTSLKITPLVQQSVIIGNNFQYKVEITPSNATNKNITWTSSDTTVATIDANGLVTAKKRGTTTITATSKDNTSIKKSVTLKVIKPTITLNSASIVGNNNLDSKALFKGSTGTITVVVNTQDISTSLKANVTNTSGSIINSFTSSVTKIVDNKATITVQVPSTVSTGTYTLNISGGNASKLQYKFTINEPIYVNSLNMTNIRTGTNMTISLTPTIKPSNAYNKTIKYTIANSDIATITNNQLTTKIPGTTTITATTTDGSNIKTTITLTVIDSIFLYSSYLPEDSYLLNIPEKTSYSKFYNSLNIKSGETVKIYNNSNKTKQITSGNIATGMVLEKTNSLGKFNYILIVKGDVSGDGIVGSNDALLIRRHAIRLTNLSNIAQKAADVDGDNKVTSADALKIRRYVVKLGTL